MSAVKKSKITKKIWFDGELWDVVELLTPTTEDHYLLCQRVRADQVHSDTKETPVNMILLDCGNDEFYPDTKKVREIMQKAKSASQKEAKRNSDLTTIWLELFQRAT